MHKITNLCENLTSNCRRSCEIIMKEKHPCNTKLGAFGCLILRPQNLILRSRIKFVENHFLFSRTTLLQREPLITMFFTIGFLVQIRQMSSQFHFRAFGLKLFCRSSCYCVSNSDFGHSISFWVESNSFSTLFNLASRIWMLLWWIVKFNDFRFDFAEIKIE